MRETIAVALLLMTFAWLATAHAQQPPGRFVGAAPLPAHDTAWVILDGQDEQAGSSTTAAAAERFARDGLRLVPGRSLFRFSAQSHGLAQLEAAFGASGDVGRSLSDIKPTTIVLVVLTRWTADAAASSFGTSPVGPSWIGNRIGQLRAASPGALIVVVADALAPGGVDALLSNAGAQAPPIHVIAAVNRGGQRSTIPYGKLAAELGRLDHTFSQVQPELDKAFQAAADAPVGLVPSLFLTALLGSAEDVDGLGYDANDLAQWVASAHGRLTGRLDPKRKKLSELASGRLWPGNDTDAAVRHPLKRAVFRIGICSSASDVLPKNGKESFDEQVSRTKSGLQTIVGDVEASVRAKLPRAAGALRIESSQPGSSGTSLPGPRACASPPRKRDFDAWAFVNHEKQGRYAFQLDRVATGELVAAAPGAPLPDAKQTVDQLAEAIRKLLQPDAIQAPILSQGIPTVESIESTPGIIFLIDRSFSNATEPLPRWPGMVPIGSDPGARNRLLAFTRLIEFAGQKESVGEEANPYAVVTFGDKATLLKVGNAHWFRVSDPVDRVRAALRAALTDNEDTNLGAALEAAGWLMRDKPDVRAWHVVLMTDGVPTVGVPREGLAQAARAAIGGRATLTSFTLFVKGSKYAEVETLQHMTNDVADGAGRRGMLISLRSDDNPSSWQPAADEVGMLITRSSRRAAFRVPCAAVAGAVRCEVHSKAEERLRFGAMSDATFVFGAEGFRAGKTQISLANQGLPGSFVSLELRENEPTREYSEGGLRVRVARSAERIFVHLESGTRTLNGDWTITVLMGRAGRTQ